LVTLGFVYMTYDVWEHAQCTSLSRLTSHDSWELRLNHDDCIRVVFVAVLPPTLLTSDLRLNEIIFLNFTWMRGT
jgi:hypothetical protein